MSIPYLFGFRIRIETADPLLIWISYKDETGHPLLIRDSYKDETADPLLIWDSYKDALKAAQPFHQISVCTVKNPFPTREYLRQKGV